MFDASGVAAGYYLARIADALQDDYNTGVITSKAVSNGAPRVERLASSVSRRGLRALLSSCVLAAKALVRMRRGDLAIAATSPPALPILMAPVSWLRGTRLVVVVHDLYPDVLAAGNVWRRNGLAARIFNFFNSRALSRADRIVVIGRDMERTLAQRLNGAGKRIEYVPHWAHENVGVVVALRQQQRPFIVQYSGNMGLAHDINSLIECAEMLDTEDSDIRFELVGWGLKLAHLKREIERREIGNIRLLNPVPRKNLAEHLSACDVAIILMMKGSQGVSVPCRMYNIMAAGKPVIVAADANAEIATIVRETRIGWVVDPGSPSALAAAIQSARDDQDELLAMGVRARALVTEQYSFELAHGGYRRIVEELLTPVQIA